MSVKMPITKARVKNHFHYGLWMYLLLIVASGFLWNLIYTTTAYRTPPELRVELYMDDYGSTTEAQMTELMDLIHRDALPGMELVSYTPMTLDQTYGSMQLSVWMAAGEGDVYLMGKDRFQTTAQGGAMIDLQPYIDEGRLHVEGLDLKRGYATDSETGERMLRGIPADMLKGLEAYGIHTEGTVFSVLAAGKNVDNAIVFLDYILTNMR